MGETGDWLVWVPSRESECQSSPVTCEVESGPSRGKQMQLYLVRETTSPIERPLAELEAKTLEVQGSSMMEEA